MKQSCSNEAAWCCIKISVSVFWLLSMAAIIFVYDQCPFPVGIFGWIDCALLFAKAGKLLLALWSLTVSVLYLKERAMLFATGSMFVIAVLVFTLQESNAVFNRTALFTSVMGAQFIAYIRHRYHSQFNLQHYRVQYPVQILAAGYTLAGISKLESSGLAWIDSGACISLQIMKNYMGYYFSTGIEAFKAAGLAGAEEAIRHSNIIRWLFVVVLCLELGCFAATVNHRVRKWYGGALVLMHAGMLYLGVFILPVIVPMVIYFLNPLHYAYGVTQRLRSAFGRR